MIRIYSDSTCDLSPELVERYAVRVIPVHVILGEKEYRDGHGITPEEIYDWADANKTTPKTAAIALNDAADVMKQDLENGDEIIAFGISESMSANAQIFRMAAQELEAEDHVSVIDSKNLSTGIGLLIIRSAEMAAEGMKREEIVEEIGRLIPKVRASFVVDTLTYLHRGGRCSAAAALAGSALKLHPMIVVENGAMDAGKKYRGKIDSVIRKYVEDMTDDLKNAEADRVFITHSGKLDRETVDGVRVYLEDLHIFNEILETRAGSVVSSHCGPGTLGVLFISR